MSTTSVMPEVLDGILAALADSPFPFPVFEAWPGPDAVREMLFFGETTWTQYQIPTIKAGRKQRQEEGSIAFELWLFGGEGNPTNVKTHRDRAFAALADLEDVLAEDVTAGTDHVTVQEVQLSPEMAGPFAYERSWMYRVAGSIAIRARLR